MIIGINGKIGSGKDTVGKIIQGLIVAKEHNVLNPNFGWIEKYHINSHLKYPRAHRSCVRRGIFQTRIQDSLLLAPER